MIIVLAPSANDALLSLDEAKAELGVSGAAEDGRVLRLVAAASGALAGLCDREEGFGREEVEETFDLSGGPCRSRLWLRRDLGPEILAVREDGAALASSSWLLDGARLWRLDASGARAAWSGSVVAVRYRAGFELPAGAPALLQEACFALARRAWGNRTRDPSVRSERTEGVGQTDYHAAGGEPADTAVDDAVARYRRFGFL